LINLLFGKIRSRDFLYLVVLSFWNVVDWVFSWIYCLKLAAFLRKSFSWIHSMPILLFNFILRTECSNTGCLVQSSLSTFKFQSFSQILSRCANLHIFIRRDRTYYSFYSLQQFSSDFLRIYLFFIIATIKIKVVIAFIFLMIYIYCPILIFMV
jgi:hypothetical protein